MEERYLIIADDFTGSNDTGVQLRRRGFPTEVLFCGKPMGADRSIVIDTESRTVHPDHAYEIVSHALEDVDLPAPVAQPRDLIVRVNAISVNPVDYKIRSSSKPAEGEAKVLGWDAVGIVEAIGTAVTKFNIGDRVFVAHLDRERRLGGG